MHRREDFEALDRADPLRAFRGEFDLPPGLVYLDGNSLGALPRRTRDTIARVVENEWGSGLIRSWNDAGWITLPQRTGDLIAALIGAGPGEVVAADSTSVNLFKAVSVALRADPSRRLVVTEKSNFPTDLYILHGAIAQLGNRHELVLVDGTDEAVEAILAERGSDVAAVVLTHVHFTTSRFYDMARVTAAAHAAGAIMVWDLSHSAGAIPVDVRECRADFAVGCGYKHLNGGPGAPAFLYAAQRFRERFAQPLSGWMGDARPFEFLPEYQPAAGISRYLAGTPPVIALAALAASVEVILEATIPAIRAKAIALGDSFVDLVDERCGGLGLALASPRPGARRGGHLSWRHEGAYAIMQALGRAGVIGDCRPPDLMRFGFAPLYVRFVDIWDAVARLEEILRTRSWDCAEFRERPVVT